MESTCARGILRRQLSHWRAILYGMPETESGGKTTACHFSTLPALQIQTTSEGSEGNGRSIRRGSQRPPLQPTASRRKANRDKCLMKWRNWRDMASLGRCLTDRMVDPFFLPGGSPHTLKPTSSTYPVLTGRHPLN